MVHGDLLSYINICKMVKCTTIIVGPSNQSSIKIQKWQIVGNKHIWQIIFEVRVLEKSSDRYTTIDGNTPYTTFVWQYNNNKKINQFHIKKKIKYDKNKIKF